MPRVGKGTTVVNDGGGGGTKTPSKDYYDRTTKMINDYRNRLNRRNTGVTSSSTDVGGDVASGSSSNRTEYWNKILNQLKTLLREQYDQANAQSKTLYEQRLAQNKEAWENDRNQANLNFRRSQRYLNSAYGDAQSGTGLSNRARNYSNWNNNLTGINKNYTNNDASALADYNANLSNNANTLAQGWYNYILPIYTQRQMQVDNLDFQKFMNGQI